MAVGTCRQIDRQFSDFDSSHVQEGEAFEKKLVVTTLDTVNQCDWNAIQTVKAKPAAGIVWQLQQRLGQEMPQMGQKSPKQIPFPQAAFALEPRSHNDIVRVLELE